MNCREVEQGEFAERYAAGALQDAERDAFEDHYFDCATCLARVEAVQGVAVALQKPVTPRRATYWPLAMAAGVMIIVGSAILFRTTAVKPSEPVLVAQAPAVAPSQNRWEELSRFEPPSYRAPVMRGGGVSKDFREGMAAYQKGEFAAALPKLRKAAETNKRDAAAGFFAGVTELIAGDVAAGVAALRAVDGLGFTPYQEEARFHLAKGLLRTGDADGARNALASVAAMKGDLEGPAQKLLGELR